MMRKFMAALALAMSALLSAPVLAQRDIDPDTASAARELLVKSGVKEQYDRSINLTIDQIAEKLLATNPGRSQQEITSALRDVLRPEFKDIGLAMTEQAVKSYAKRFTAQELRELIAFYDTPLGQKLLRETTGLAVELLQISNAVGWEGIRRSLDKHRDTLRQRGVNVPL